jgi:PheRS DNA binding domain 3
VWAVLPLKGKGNGMSIKDLRQAVGDESAKIGQGRAFKSGWIGKEGDNLVKLVRILEYPRRLPSILIDAPVRSNIDPEYCRCDSGRADRSQEYWDFESG